MAYDVSLIEGSDARGLVEMEEVLNRLQIPFRRGISTTTRTTGIGVGSFFYRYEDNNWMEGIQMYLVEEHGKRKARRLLKEHHLV